MNSDRIEKKVLLRASPQRVWRALSDSTEFGSWFGMKFEGQFAPGTSLRGVIVPTSVDAEVAKAQKPYEGTPVELMIEQMETERLFSFRWHPGAVEPGIDYSVEPTTLVVFELEKVADGILLTITESGFDEVPLARRAKTLSANEKGWSMVVKLIEKYMGHAQ
jgi:uncharacterized protein YndB with AHSA1/START domain